VDDVHLNGCIDSQWARALFPLRLFDWIARTAYLPTGLFYCGQVPSGVEG
jgi:hypothetical protein